MSEHQNQVENVKTLADGITISGVFGYLTGWFTLPNLITVFTLIWAFGRAVETATGKPLHEHIKAWRNGKPKDTV
jgi:hypothetical protein